jgi:hypothetical protein
VADSITSGVTGGNGIAIGPDGRLYLATGASLLVFDPPFSHASAPTVTVPITSGLFVALGIAIGK